MRVIKKKECLQTIDSLIGKIDLLEETMSLQVNSNVSQESEQLLQKMEIIELYTNHVENRILFYSNDNYIGGKIVS